MATTISIRVAGKPSAGPGGDGSGGKNGRFWLGAKLAAGVAILGCAAALTLGGVWTGSAAPAPPRPAPQATFLPAGTDDLATVGCIGTAGPFGCQAGQSLAGTDDFSTTGCFGVAGPFACASVLPAVTHGTADLAINGSDGTIDFGPVECGIVPCGVAPAMLPARVLPTIDFGPMECGAAPCTSVPASLPD